jgi:hypothetical protein
MKRCNHCGRYAVDHPTYCPSCGRSYNVRICARGHVNPRTNQFCTLCGSSDLSTPAPPERLGWSSWLYVVFLIGSMSAVLGMVSSVDWRVLAEPLAQLLVLLGLLYWTTTRLPGPIRQVGRLGSRWLMTRMRKRGQRR